jgi:hypothetical protein
MLMLARNTAGAFFPDGVADCSDRKTQLPPEKRVVGPASTAGTKRSDSELDLAAH